MKKLLQSALIMVGALATLTSCGDDGKVQIGIIQYATHDALDKAREGFIDGINEGGLKDEVKFTTQNANGETSTLNSISSSFARKSDLILAIATPAAISAKSALEMSNKTTPLLFTAVTDAVEANLIASNENPGGHVTGTLDMNPVAEQIGLFKELNPSISKIGMIYTSSETNSIIQINLAKEACTSLGMTYVEASVTSANDIPSVLSNLIRTNSIEGLYIPTDNVIASAMPIVRNTAKDAKIPVIAGETSMVENGALLTYGLDYYELGKKTALMAIDIISNGKLPSEIPSEGLDEFPLIINNVVAKEYDITIPQALLNKASRIIESEE